MMKERRYQPTYPASCHRQCPVRPQSAPPSAAGCQYWWPQNSPSCQCQHCNTIHQHFTWCWRSVNSSFCHCQHYNTITSQDVYAHKQPVLPMQALQHNYFTCLCSQNSLYCQCKHYNAITSHDVYAHKTACTANASTITQLLHMMFMLTKQPVLPMQALQCNYFSWHLCYLKKNSPFCQCQHYNAITSHDVYI